MSAPRARWLLACAKGRSARTAVRVLEQLARVLLAALGRRELPRGVAVVVRRRALRHLRSHLLLDRLKKLKNT
jgi:hypothetical protein